MASASRRRSLRRCRSHVVSAAVVAVGTTAGVLVMSANAGTTAPGLYHQTLVAKDGWASSGSGTTGGAQADVAHTFTVSTRVHGLHPRSRSPPARSR